MLGERSSTKGYTYGNVIRNLSNVFFCGADCAEDIQTHVGNDLKLIPGHVVSSADTVLRVIKELATKNIDTKYSVGQHTIEAAFAAANCKRAFSIVVFETDC